VRRDLYTKATRWSKAKIVFDCLAVSTFSNKIMIDHALLTKIID